MAIEAIYDDNFLCSLNIDGEIFESEDSQSVTVPIPVLLKQQINDLPEGILIELCDLIAEDVVMCHNLPMTISLTSCNKVKVSFDERELLKYWDAPLELKLWMETKRDVIVERNKNLNDVVLEGYNDGGADISLTYSCEIEANTFDDLIQAIDQITAEIDGATDIALGSPFEKIENCKKESDFTVKILLPLFRNLGFSNVKYNHGNKEYGKDITFARRSEFDEYEYYGVQVKYGDISGGANGEINGLINQTIDAFKMPFYDVYSRRKVRISKMVIAISGKFTQNAIEKVVDGITEFPLKNNIIFIDGEKIRTLLDRYRRAI